MSEPTRDIGAEVGAGTRQQPFVIAPGPHVHAADSTRSIMWTVNATLAPAALWGAFVFGWRALVVILASIAGSVAAEWLTARALRVRPTPQDGSAFCSGLLLALTLPPLVPWWTAVLGGAFGIVFGKMIFGGLGFNLFNPALIGRAFMMATFPLPMTAGWQSPKPWFAAVDAVTTATPLGALRERGLDAAMALAGGQGSPWSGLFFGLRPGSIGETSVLLLAIGGGFLLARRIIKPAIPLAVFAGVLLTTGWTGLAGFHLLSGGLWLGAIFMATDYVTSPTTREGQVVFGLLIGALTGVIRMYGGYPEGICYAILIANTLVPALNLVFRPKRTQVAGAPS